MNKETLRLECFKALLVERRDMSVSDICLAMADVEAAIFRRSDPKAPEREGARD